MTAHLVIGGNGLIGTALCDELARRNNDHLATTRRTDDPNKLLFVLGKDDPYLLPQASVVYLVAARPGFSACEGDAESWVVNVDAQIAIARRFIRHNPSRVAFIVYVSSDAVEWCGGTAYARQKAQVEAYIQSIDGAIIRPTRVTPVTVKAVAGLMIDVGIARTSGVHRWKP
jgi:nucleoside-diphosphate-sugar epimerase